MNASAIPDPGDGLPGGALTPPPGEGPVERVCKWASEAALIIMLVVIGADVFTRYLFNFSFEIADEIGGYMLVVMTFVSLSVCQVTNSFHQVELIHGTHERVDKVVRCGLLDAEIFVGAAARVDGQNNRKRHPRLAFEEGNFLGMAVLGEAEIVLGESSHRCTLLIGHVHEDVDQAMEAIRLLTEV